MPVESEGTTDSEFKYLRTRNLEIQLKKAWAEQAVFWGSVLVMDISMIFMDSTDMTADLIHELLHRQKISITGDLGIIQPH